MNSASGLVTKRAHKSLSIADKVKILDKIGEKSYKLLAEEYGVGISTISDIKKKGPELRNYKRKMAEMGCRRVAKSMRMGKDQELDMAVFLWFRQKREEGVPLTGNCMEVALPGTVAINLSFHRPCVAS